MNDDGCCLSQAEILRVTMNEVNSSVFGRRQKPELLTEGWEEQSNDNSCSR